jgi:hypothetical protein
VQARDVQKSASDLPDGASGISWQGSLKALIRIEKAREISSSARRLLNAHKLLSRAPARKSC